MSDAIYDILNEVGAERLNQIETWGEQSHRSSFGEGSRRQFAKQADHWKAVNAARVRDDSIAWDGILLEEVYEALAEKDDTARRAELVQVAAVAVAEIEAIDRRSAYAELAQQDGKDYEPVEDDE